MVYLYDWFSDNIPVWKKHLSRFENKKNLLFLEIGCFEGRATRWLLDNILTHETSRIIVVDTFGGGEDQHDIGINTKGLLERFKENMGKYYSEAEDSKVIVKKGRSFDVLKSLDLSEGAIDLIYIDGSHLARDVIKDAILSWPLLKAGGILIFDDYSWDKYDDPTLNPRIAIESFLQIFEGEYKILEASYQAIIEKKPNLSQSDSKTETFLQNIKRGVDVEEFEEMKRQLRVIKSAKFFKFWQLYCSVRDKLKNFLFGVSE